MRLQRIELGEIAAWNNLLLASWKAAQGKRTRPDVSQFLADLDNHLAKLQADILGERVPYGDYRSFMIHDPKPRLIHAAGFADRVLHHAVMNLAEPVFEKSLVDTTFACRPAKGVHRAVMQVQRYLQRYPWYAQVDVSGYFPSIDHARLLEILSRRFKGVGFLALLRRIIESYAAKPGKGLPIGSLSSQHFANYYLDGADRFLLRHSAVKAHVRYMDDIVCWCADKQGALRVLQEFSAYLADERFLCLKPNHQINQSRFGMRYCGFRIYPGVIRLTVRKQRRYRELRQHYEQDWEAGYLTDRGLQSAYDGILAATYPAASRSWRQRDLQLHPFVYDNSEG